MTENIVDRIYVAFDLETTGLNPETDEIIEIGAVKFSNGRSIDIFQTLVNPHKTIPYNIRRLCNISQAEVDQAPSFSDVATELESFIESYPLVGHNVSFDQNFLMRKGLGHLNPTCDTLDMARLLLPGIPERNLSSVAHYLAIPNSNAHRALADAQMSAEIFTTLLNSIYEIEPVLLNELARLTNGKDWWLGYLLTRVVQERGASLLLSEAGLEKVCFGSVKARKKETLFPNEERSLVDIDELTHCFDSSGLLARAFPGYEERIPQIQMMQSVAKALNEEQHLIVEAGTGTGKSMAYLLPFASFALLNNAPVVISTNTINLQEQLVKKDIPDLLNALGPQHPVSGIRIAQLKGRTNYLCLRRWEIMRKNEGLSLEAVQFLARIQIWLPSSSDGDRAKINIDARELPLWHRICAQVYDCLGKKCSFHQKGLCFLHRVRKEAESAHLIVINHALLLSEMSAGGQILPPYSNLVIDEAHHLEEVATSQLGIDIREKDLFEYLDQVFHESDGLRSGVAPQLQYLSRSADSIQSSGLQEVSESLTSGAAKARKRVEKFFHEVSILLQNLGEGQGEYDLNLRVTSAVRAQPAWSEVEIQCENLIGVLGEIGKSLRKAGVTVENLSVSETLRFEILTVLNICDELQEQLDSLVFHPDGNTINWITLARKNSMVTLHSAPLHVGLILQNQLYMRMDALILTGATLSTEGNFEYLKERLGLDNMLELRLDSPFDYEKAALIYLVSDIPAPGNTGYQEALGQALVSVCTAMEGRSLVLFTSHAALRATKDAIAEDLMVEDILVLGQGVDGAPRKLLASLQGNNRTVILGAASFWEGVDVMGDALSMLGIVRLPFSVPSDPVFAARSETFKNPFNEYTLPQAAFKFKQGFGRLIRSKTDHGVLVVLDSRISNKGYGKMFVNSLPSCKVEKGLACDLPRVVRDWFEEKDESKT